MAITVFVQKKQNFTNEMSAITGELSQRSELEAKILGIVFKLFSGPCSHGLRPKKVYTSVTVLPDPIRVPSQWSLVPSFTPITYVD